jgi:oligopeptide transport system substrate-binding protein
VLRVRLTRPDANFPALVAHPVFYPVHDGGKASIESLVDNHGALPLITNGAFRLTKISTGSVLLERAGNYWDASEVNLHSVRFVSSPNAESALAAYRAGEVDAVTNAGFEPLALKMLTPYKDFRRATYGALTFYKLNTAKPPFDDVRVRQALALAIDRERLSEDEMGGATEPAKKFLPAQIHDQNETKADAPLMLEHDVERARQLLADAGFPLGKDFPLVRLLINRNDQQRLVAQAVAAMWKNALGIETEIIVKDWEAYEAALLAGDYDVARRAVVMQTPDEAINLRAMFEPEIVKPILIAALKSKQETELSTASTAVTTEAQALREMPAIPLYFASSYSLIKPYVEGFDANILDAPSLKHVRIDTNWRMPQKPAAHVAASDE